MARNKIPPADVPAINLPSGTLTPDYYDLLRQLDELDPLSDIDNSAILASIATKADRDQTINAQTGTTYTLVLADDGKYLTFTNASAITATVPPNSSVAFPLGTRIDWKQGGAGKLTWAQGAGVTINSFLSNKSAAGQHAGGTLIKTATDTWDLFGTLTV